MDSKPDQTGRKANMWIVNPDQTGRKASMWTVNPDQIGRKTRLIRRVIADFKYCNCFF